MKVWCRVKHLHKELESWIAILELAAKLLSEAFCFRRQTRNALLFGDHCASFQMFCILRATVKELEVGANKVLWTLVDHRAS